MRPSLLHLRRRLRLLLHNHRFQSRLRSQWFLLRHHLRNLYSPLLRFNNLLSRPLHSQFNLRSHLYQQCLR